MKRTQLIVAATLHTESLPGRNARIVAIDGPAGAGKSTVAREIARRLGWQHIDTGAMYRCVALLAQRQGISPGDAAGLSQCACTAKIEFCCRPENQQVLLDGEDVTATIREDAIGNLASVVSQVAGVRQALVQQQQEIGRRAPSVMDGRDVGTVVFPDAAVKIFLTASAAERSSRRVRDLAASGAAAVDAQQVEREMRERDQRDQQRALAPLVPAADAVEINTDNLSIQEVVEQIEILIREKGV